MINDRATAPDFSGRPVTVFGGGSESLGKIAAFLADGAAVTVIAPSASASVEDLADRGLITWHRRGPTTSDLADIDFAVGFGSNAPTGPSQAGSGMVILVGGGPGDPGLLTVAGREALESADVIVTDRLAPLAALCWARSDAEIVDVAKVPRGRSTSQPVINDLLIDHARAGKIVVRLKGGDNFVFGRGGEELIACRAAGVDAQVIPGVSSAIAAPAVANIPVTHRGLTQAFTAVSGHVPPGHPDSTIDYKALAASGATLIFMMAVRTLPAIAAALIDAGMDPQTPAATIADGAMVSQRAVRAPLAAIAQAVAEARISAPAVTVIGAVAQIDGLS